MHKRIDSIVAKSICQFSTEETFKFRCVSSEYDFTIYLKEIGLEKFISFLKMKCSNKYGTCEAFVNDKNSVLTISPIACSPFLSFEFTPSSTVLPAIIGNYSCAFSTDTILSGHFKYYLGLPLPSIDLGYHCHRESSGNIVEVKLISGQDDYKLNLLFDFYLTRGKNRSSISVFSIPFSYSKLSWTFSNPNAFLQFKADLNSTISSKIYKEIPISSYFLGFRSRLKKPLGDPLQKWIGVGFKVPFENGYACFAFNSEFKLSSKLKFKIPHFCELSSTLQLSNWKMDDPHLGLSVCFFPDENIDLDPQNLEKQYKQVYYSITF